MHKLGQTQKTSWAELGQAQPELGLGLEEIDWSLKGYIWICD